MQQTLRLFLVALASFALAPRASAQNWGNIEGTIVSAKTNFPIPGATVSIRGTGFGTVTDGNGSFRLRIPAGAYAVQASFVGYISYTDSVFVSRDATSRFDARLVEDTIELGEVTVEDVISKADPGVYSIEPKDIKTIPGPFKDVFRALKVVPGVATNNELSYQYSVRGGGYNENLVFVDGFEIFFPFRPRQGEQEGLSLLNPDLAQRITFFTGGFPARYGGKLSSALDVEYLQPDESRIRGSVYASTLDAGASASGKAGRFTFVGGARKARPGRFFATQDLKGAYDPDYTDFQGKVTFQPSPNMGIEALGMWADHSFSLDPNSRKVFFGTVSQDSRLAPSNLKSLFTSFDPDNIETDGFATRFAGVRMRNLVANRFSVTHDAAYYSTDESEFRDLSGQSILFLVDPGSGGSEEGQLKAGTSREEESADNSVVVTTLTGQGSYAYSVSDHIVEGGWYLRSLKFEDRLNEKRVVIGPTVGSDELTRIVVDSLQDAVTLNTAQAGGYVQTEMNLSPTTGRVIATAGLRADYFDLTGEWTLSPRASIRYRYSTLLSLFGSVGVYYQAPTYRELRGAPDSAQTILGAINRKLKSQRSIQSVAGFEYFFPRKQFTLRTEAYYKNLSNLISYSVENIRIEYSGENDSKGYAFGLDAQLRGEFVPGLESWVNYSFLNTKENFLEEFETQYNTGWVPRPTDQRHTISLFIQDYIPGDDRWKLHMRTLLGSGLPYTPPVPGPFLGSGVRAQAPGPRNGARFDRYFRFDIGTTFEIPLFGHEGSNPVNLQLTGEILNLFDMVNEVAYSWVPDASGIWNRIPTRLTPRTINVRARIDF
ncbi:MAG: TonB-dependent receptor [Rhodothermales bacterium]